jgi:hypothetical protein
MQDGSTQIQKLLEEGRVEDARVLALALIDEAIPQEDKGPLLVKAIVISLIESTLSQNRYIANLKEILKEMKEIGVLRKGMKDQRRFVELSKEINTLVKERA